MAQRPCIVPIRTVQQKCQEIYPFVSKWGMDIDGLSIQTMLRFMNAGFIHEFADIFRLKEHFGEISQMEGFGEKSVANMEQSIEKAGRYIR